MAHLLSLNYNNLKLMMQIPCFNGVSFELIVDFCLLVAIDDVFDNHINYLFIIIIYILGKVPDFSENP
jgi:hypothetical protein